jgi:DNA primase
MDFAGMATQELGVSSGSFDAKERVKQAVDIVELVGRHITLRRQGRNYVGLCPWHPDKRPSLQVNPERQSWRCWVCPDGGDVFSFVMKIEGVGFREALEMLAEQAGIVLEKPQRRRHVSSPGGTTAGSATTPNDLLNEAADGPPDEAATVQQSATPTGDKRTLLQAMAWAEEQYHRCLLEMPEADVARRYLQERGINAEMIERFRLGFSPLERDWILRQAEGRKGDRSNLREAPERPFRQIGPVPFSPEGRRRAGVLEAIGILARGADGGSYYDRFRGRLLFSIHDTQRRPVGIGGRLLPELGLTSPAKYVNSPETPLFTKSKLLYGLDLARESLRKMKPPTALVMEGYTDVIVAHQFGFQNAVAVLGTALGEEHVKILKRHSDRIVLVLDGDEAGTRRANEVLELFVAEQADLRILTLPEDLDPCDYLHKYGAAAFSELLDTKAVDALDHAFEAKTRGIDLERDVHRASAALEELIAIVAKGPRLRHDTTRDARFREEKILQRLAARFRVEELEVRKRLTALRRAQTARPQLPVEAAAAAAASPDSAAGTPAAIDPWQRELLEVLVAHPQCIGPARGRIEAAWLSPGACRRIYETCCRLADEGVNATFDRLMLEFDEPAVKSLLVELDDGGAAKGLAATDPLDLLEKLTETMIRREVERQRPAQFVALREGGLDAQQKAAMLEAILRQERNRQGISKPTDG